MTPLWTAQEAQQATGGTGPQAWSATGVSIDTRELQSGDLFVALKDVRDGHEFVAQALAAGAAAALVSHRPEGVAEDAPLLIVPDVLKALEELGIAARARMHGKVIAVTGSVGKTGTKDMLRSVLGEVGIVHAAERSFNNHWGVPLTLARMPRETDFAVIEIGMNAPGEIAPLSRLARPHVAIVTTVAAVHAAAFTDVRGIAREKASIVAGLEPGGTAILNRDDATYRTVRRRAERAGASIVTFGGAGRPMFRLISTRLRGATTCAIARVRGDRLLFKLGTPGRHLAMNAMAVLAAVEAVGADVAQAAMRLGRWSAPDGRGARWRIRLGQAAIDGSLLLIDDAYNANPTSMAAAFDVLDAAEPKNGIGRVAKGRRVAFLTDMLELGPDAERHHAALADLRAIERIDRIHCAGPLMRALHKALPPARRGEWYATADELAARAGRLLDAGDVALVKGSKGSRASRVVDAVLKLGQAVPAQSTEDEDA
ncbi:UDP-N-acetylmuramoyl-tripeptide--D-alanyl-D-alanine ligase [Pontivivens nitratireducens]|uniref:UDP-N-acetylmuramoyl-tripeptide--D-alanyl-D-alanine ligase n=1 Tax=Pontivivens nitratireducens TaxID=2758038 RepID=A0A6G7VNF0_9RHOB|nr:UDP-N-acetylmuramoyl-tripeptide--D-alanyl-D-alanine ligase [Pontibrevibacter nitratireducens]QIK41613.1 UDP-N-acetylmuramoyl-tripeptide--D-alanyl-D-alanine ligase [Pontibrevibacter nitratireducens]